MDFLGRVEVDEFEDKPRIVLGPNKRFVGVRFGWYAYNFIVGEKEVITYKTALQAIETAKAVKELEGGQEDYLSYQAQLARKLFNLLKGIKK
jgi:hypothetical protein